MPTDPEPQPFEIPLCRFGDKMAAVARYAFDEGCVCFPKDREQDLCAQHASDSQPHCCMERIKLYDQSWPWDKSRTEL